MNDQDLRDLNLGQLRNSVVLVRDTEIIHASIADNLGLGRELDPNGIREALITVGLQDVIAALPEYLDTTINLNGMPLSREQCLRLTLARALLQKPRLLLLDRVLDRIDVRHVPALLETLLSENVPWTLIASSQQTQVIRAVKRRIRLENGDIAETNLALEKAS